jgi:hypothetical protein
MRSVGYLDTGNFDFMLMLPEASGVASVLAGLDMAMPTTKYLGFTNFTQAIRNGSVPLTRLNDMATRLVAQYS